MNRVGSAISAPLHPAERADRSVPFGRFVGRYANEKVSR